MPYTLHIIHILLWSTIVNSANICVATSTERLGGIWHRRSATVGDAVCGVFAFQTESSLRNTDEFVLVHRCVFGGPIGDRYDAYAWLALAIGLFLAALAHICAILCMVARKCTISHGQWAASVSVRNTQANFGRQ